MSLQEQWKHRLISHKKISLIRKKRNAIAARAKALQEKQRVALKRQEERKAQRKKDAYEKKKAAGEIPPEFSELVSWIPPTRPIDFFQIGDICDRRWPGDGEWKRCIVTAIHVPTLETSLSLITAPLSSTSSSSLLVGSGNAKKGGGDAADVDGALDIDFVGTYRHERNITSFEDVRFHKPRPRWKAGKRWRTVSLAVDVPTSRCYNTTAPLGLTMQANTKGKVPLVLAVESTSIFSSQVCPGDKIISMNGISTDHSRADGVRQCFHAACTSRCTSTAVAVPSAAPSAAPSEAPSEAAPSATVSAAVSAVESATHVEHTEVTKTVSGTIATSRRILVEVKRSIDVALRVQAGSLNGHLRRVQERQRREREGVPSICQNGGEPVIESTISYKGTVKPPKDADNTQ